MLDHRADDFLQRRAIERDRAVDDRCALTGAEMIEQVQGFDPQSVLGGGGDQRVESLGGEEPEQVR